MADPGRRWTLELWELPDHRVVIAGALPGRSWREALEIIAAAVDRELAGEILSLPGLCPAALGVEGSTVARRE